MTCQRALQVEALLKRRATWSAGEIIVLVLASMALGYANAYLWCVL